MYVLLLQHDMAKTLVWRHKLKYKPDMSNNMRQQRSMAFPSIVKFYYFCLQLYSLLVCKLVCYKSFICQLVMFQNVFYFRFAVYYLSCLMSCLAWPFAF